MNKTIFTILLLLITLSACNSIKKGLKGEGKKGTDEFLVEKKSPLILPPNFDELPVPTSETDNNVALTKEDTSSIEDIINQSSSTDTSKKNNNLKNSIEESIIEKINRKKIKEVSLDETLEETIEEKITMPKKEGFFGRLKNKFKNTEH